ncbi:histone deacetylase HDT2-like [Silene latifolia]|uniref:histone deacetylase HDT2-like n=1 Tax=Silene latifolia TaxID=37657 RepID=UPI003D7768F4
MAGPMQFWGLEVKAKEPCKVSLEDGYIIHVSQATLGDIKKDNEPVIVHVKAGDKKLVMGILSQKTPQLSFDLVFDTDFEISHNWKNGSIHLMGYQTELGGSDTEFDSSDEDEEPIPILRENGGLQAALAASKASNMLKPDEDDSDDDDSSEDGEDEDSKDGDDDQDISMASSEDSENDDDEDDSDSEDEDDTTPVKIDASKKRPNADAKTPQSKKAKIATPQKTDGKKGSIVHPATPHPVKKGGKTPAGDKTPKSGDKTPKSGGSEVSCGSCKKTFKSDVALQSHSKAKHGAK